MRLYVLCIASVLCWSSPNLLYSQSSTTVDSLPDVNAVRPIDLINQTEWNISSPDFFTFWLDGSLYGYYGPQPQILLDGLPVDVNFWGWQNLNMLPIYLPKIAVVSARPGVQQYKNTFYPSGTMDFSGNEPDSGWAASTGFYWGNETGDPGPWIYDSSRVTPNVDRWGPDVGGVLSYGSNNWYGKGIFMLRNHQQTDPISHRRLHSTMRELGANQFYPIKTTSQSGLLETGYLSKLWQFKARGILARDKNYLFLQPFGREIPSQSEYQQLVLDGTYTPDRWEFNLRYTLEQKILTRRNDKHSFIFDWDELSTSYAGAASYSSKSLTVSGSTNLEQKKIKAPGITKQNHLVPGFSLGIDLKTGTNSRLQIDTHIDIHQKHTAETVKGTFWVTPSEDWSVKSIGLYSEILPIRQQSFGYWITQGYNFFKELEIPVNQPLAITNNKLTSFTLINKIDVSNTVSLSLSQQFFHHFTLNIPWQTVSYSTNFDSEPGIFSITQESGSRISLKGSITHIPGQWFNHQLSIHFQESLDGSQRYRDYFRQIPREQLVYQLHVSPVPNLTLSIQSTYRSSTKWKEFDALDGEEYRDVDNLFPVLTGTFSNTVPAHFNIDLSTKKWFWKKRLSVQFTVQNLLNEEIRMHPMGADRSFIFNIKAVASF